MKQVKYVLKNGIRDLFFFLKKKIPLTISCFTWRHYFVLSTIQIATCNIEEINSSHCFYIWCSLSITLQSNHHSRWCLANLTILSNVFTGRIEFHPYYLSLTLKHPSAQLVLLSYFKFSSNYRSKSSLIHPIRAADNLHLFTHHVAPVFWYQLTIPHNCYTYSLGILFLQRQF